MAAADMDEMQGDYADSFGGLSDADMAAAAKRRLLMQQEQDAMKAKRDQKLRKIASTAGSLLGTAIEPAGGGAIGSAAGGGIADLVSIIRG